MSIAFTFDRKRGLLFTKAQGAVTYEDICAHLMDERKACGLNWPEIIDARSATFRHRSCSTALVWLLSSLGEMTVLGPTAFIVSTPVAFGVIRMPGTLCGNMCAIAPFWTQQEAEAWIAKGAPTDDATR